MKASFAGTAFALASLPTFGRGTIRFRAQWSGDDWRPLMRFDKSEDLVLPGYGVFRVLMQEVGAPQPCDERRCEVELTFLRVVDPPLVTRVA